MVRQRAHLQRLFLPTASLLGLVSPMYMHRVPICNPAYMHRVPINSPIRACRVCCLSLPGCGELPLLTCSVSLFSDHAELPAQVRASDSHSESRRPAADDHQPFLPGDPVYSRDGVPERGGMRGGGETSRSLHPFKWQSAVTKQNSGAPGTAFLSLLFLPSVLRLKLNVKTLSVYNNAKFCSSSQYIL